MKMILGRKVGMTRVYDRAGKIQPVTLVSAGPCFITQRKDIDRDGYFAIQIGFGKKKKITKAERGHLDRADKKFPNFKYLKELRIKKKEDFEKFKEKREIKVNDFEEGEKVEVFGISKGRGFAGVIKRYGFHGQSKTHGHKHDLRKPGSIGSTDLERVRKGLRMAGRMGQDKVMLRNLEVIKIDSENNLLAIKGAVPGAKNGLVIIKGV